MFPKLTERSWLQPTRSSGEQLLSSTQHATPARSTSSSTLQIAGNRSHHYTWTLLMLRCGFSLTFWICNAATKPPV
eukprot:922330-Pleurochrysis_carterae.AAC.1